MTYSATLADGSALPSWLTFNSTNLKFSGNPPSGQVKNLAIKITATDTSLASASQNFNLNITSNIINGTNSDDKIKNTTIANDEIYTLSGNDAIYDQGGADIIDGGEGNDIMRYDLSTEAVTVNLTTNINIGGYAQGDKLYNIERIYGSAFNDNLTGDANDNTIYGADGNDVINGNDGNDSNSGGNGNDVLNGNNGNDKLAGENGNDILTGGLGIDTLTGGAGNDIFNFSSLSDSTRTSCDLITDFTKGEDLINLSNNLNFNNIIYSTISNSASTLNYYYDSSHNTIIQNQNKTFQIKLTREINLGNDDFMF